MNINITVNETSSKNCPALVERLGALVTLLSAVSEAEVNRDMGQCSPYAVGLDYLSRELEAVYEGLYDELVG